MKGDARIARAMSANIRNVIHDSTPSMTIPGTAAAARREMRARIPHRTNRARNPSNTPSDKSQIGVRNVCSVWARRGGTAIVMDVRSGVMEYWNGGILE
jgi:hypothetical protein